MPGQADVEHDEVGRLVRRELEALLAAARDRDLVALLLEGVLDPAGDGELVFDDEDRGGHRGDATPGRWTATGSQARERSRGTLWAAFRAPRDFGSAGETQPVPNTPNSKSLRSRGSASWPPPARRSPPSSARSPARRSPSSAATAACRPSSSATASIPTNVSLDAHEFELLRRHAGPNALVDLSVDGKKAAARCSSTASRSIRSTAATLHVDLFLVRMTEELTVDVPLVATGESPAVELQGGTLLHPIESVRVRALPDHLPQSIEYSIESLVDFDA